MLSMMPCAPHELRATPVHRWKRSLATRCGSSAATSAYSERTSSVTSPASGTPRAASSGRNVAPQPRHWMVRRGIVIWPHKVSALTLRVWTVLLTAALVGFQRGLGRKNFPSHVSHLLEGGQRSAADAVAVGCLQNILNHARAPIQQLFYDNVVVPGVPPAETSSCVPFQQDTPWTTDLQFEGTPLRRLKAEQAATTWMEPKYHWIQPCPSSCHRCC